MDSEVSGWILDFLFRQLPVDNRSLLNDIIGVLPSPDNNPRLKKRLFLEQIESEIEKGKVSIESFACLEQLEEIDIRDGKTEVSEPMKVAYCAVAVHCVTKFIADTAGDDNEERARDLYRIWGERILKMEWSEVANSVGLVQDDFLRWMNDIANGVFDVEFFEKILSRVKSLDVFEVLRRYVNYAKEEMGPSFLEISSETVMQSDELRKMIVLDEVTELNDPLKDVAPTVSPGVREEADVDVNISGKGNESSPEQVPSKQKHIATNSSKRSHRGIEIVDPLEIGSNCYDTIPSPEVNKIQKDLETSSFELHAVVWDPLVDASRLAESYKTSTSGQNSNQNQVAGECNMLDAEEAPNLSPDKIGKAPNSSPDKNGNALDSPLDKAPEDNGDDGFCRDQNSGKGNEASPEQVPSKQKHIATKCSKRSHRGVKIVDPLEIGCNRYDTIPTPEVNKVQKDLETSSFELHAAVRDPLADALRLAESFKTSTSGQNSNQNRVAGDSNRLDAEEAPNSPPNKNGKAPEDNGDDGFCRDQNKRSKPSLMERNKTAHTLEWSDSIDNSSNEGSPIRPHLPSPKKRNISPLKIYKMEKITRKRKNRRWSVIEEDTLRTGVEKYGRGNWKTILSMYRDIFEDRNEVDLKDKWRNLTR